MEIRVEQDSVQDRVRFIIEGSGVELAYLGREITVEVRERATDAIVQKFIDERGAEMLAAIPVDVVMRIITEKLTRRIGEEKTKV